MANRNFNLIHPKYLARIALVTALLLPFFLLSTKLVPWTQSLWVQSVVYPFEYSWFLVRSNVGYLSNHYVLLHRASIENDRLKSENESLRIRMLDYEEQTKEINRLRSILEFSEKSTRQSVVAEVLSIPQNIAFSTLRINRGRSKGVFPGMPVMTASGVVGKIIRSSPYFSDVQLISDANFNLDVLVQRTRVRGILKGNGIDRCTLQMERDAEIRIGDSIITSGITGAFPKGIPVGRVTKITYATDTVAQTIVVEPWVDHRRIEELTILLLEDPELKKIVDTAGNEWLDRSLEKAYGGG